MATRAKSATVAKPRAKTSSAHFSPELFKFLRQLKKNNRREWFDKNKSRYLEQVRDPMLQFIEDYAPRLHSISPYLVADPRPVGGSMFRIYRDVRFSKDKTPYKTNVGIQFRHEQGKDIHAPGFYLHIEPRACFTGVGLWTPETQVARAIRQAIHDKPTEWKRAAKAKSFTGTWSIEPHAEDMLKRVPKEFDEGAPYPDDLRLKSFMAGSSLSQGFVTSAEFDTELATMFRKASNFTEFLCDAIGVPF